jgi:transcriptional regulator with XRE-family HTH domain
MARKFSSLVKKFRLKAGIGLRRFAELIEMAPSNWAAIEAGRRGLPADRATDIAEALGLTEGSAAWTEFFDAAKEPGEFPADVRHLAKRRLIPALLRTIDNRSLNDVEIQRLIDDIQNGESNS